MGLLPDRPLGLHNPAGDLARLHRGHGLMFRSVELGVGCRGNALCAAGAGRRSDAADCGVLSCVDGLDGGYGLGLGDCGVGGDEVFSTREDSRRLRSGEISGRELRALRISV